MSIYKHPTRIVYPICVRYIKRALYLAAYYRLNYRVNDKDVIMRLRAWGANVEVLYPQKLRDRMIEDITNTYAIYQ